MNLRFPVIALGVFVAASTIQAQDAVPLKTEFPPPLFVGTPPAAKLPNLEPINPNKKQELMVPAGTTNIAKGKKVAASDSDPLLGTLALLTDGDKAGDEGCYVELGQGKQWVQIDLGAKSDIYAVWLWHFHAQARAYRAVIVQSSNDPDFIDGVTTIFNNDDANTSGLGVGKDFAYIETNQGRLIPAKPGTQGRYVRLYSSGNTSNAMNHYVEAEVFGKKVQ